MNTASIDIKDMLVADSTLALTFGTDLFIGKEGKSPDNCVSIFDTPSYPPEQTLDLENRLYNSSVQIRIRNNSYPAGMDLAWAILDYLCARAQETWNSTLYTVITALGEPALMEWDGNNRAIIIINFNMKRR